MRVLAGVFFFTSFFSFHTLIGFTTSFIFATDDAFIGRVGSHREFSIDPKTLWMWCRFELRSRIYASWIGNFSKRLKYLRANQILLSSEYHYKCVYNLWNNNSNEDDDEWWNLTFTSVIRMVTWLKIDWSRENALWPLDFSNNNNNNKELWKMSQIYYTSEFERFFFISSLSIFIFLLLTGVFCLLFFNSMMVQLWQ